MKHVHLLKIWAVAIALLAGLASGALHAETRLDWNKINRLVPAWPIVDVPAAIDDKLIAHWESGAVSYTCPSSPGHYDKFPSKYGAGYRDGCNHLDSTLFNGLLCGAGYEAGCRAVQQAQRANGEWFRSPMNRFF